MGILRAYNNLKTMPQTLLYSEPVRNCIDALD